MGVEDKISCHIQRAVALGDALGISDFQVKMIGEWLVLVNLRTGLTEWIANDLDLFADGEAIAM